MPPHAAVHALQSQCAALDMLRSEETKSARQDRQTEIRKGDEKEEDGGGGGGGGTRSSGCTFCKDELVNQSNQASKQPTN